ncbi:MAG: hypothetical protein WC061_01665 [Melioribacteraceae bacterium]
MELVDIISDILIFGGSLLTLVVFISFIISKKKGDELIAAGRENKNSIDSDSRVNFGRGSEQKYLRANNSASVPQIFQLDNTRQRELKIIRKSTVTARDTQENSRIEFDQQTKADGSGNRYTIVNEELKKSPGIAANFSS